MSKMFKLIFMLALLLSPGTLTVSAQNDGAVLEIKNEPLPQVLRQLEMKTDYRFLYLNDDLRGYTFTGDLTLKDINSTMTQLLDGKPLGYTVNQQYVTVTKQGSTSATSAYIVRGKVVDENGAELPGVNIRVQGGKTYAVTDINGIYTIEVHANDVLRFTQPVIDTMVINRSMEQNRIYAHFPASAQQRMQDTVLVLRGGGHPRLLSQRGNYFDNITSASITDAWNKCFGSASGYTFVITGAQPADSLRPLVEKYIASLPASAGKAKWIDHGMYGYRGVTERTVNTGVMGGAAMVVIGISAPMSYTPANELKNRIVARIVQQRAMNEMREKSGDVYTINVNQESRSVPRGAFEVSAEFQADTVNAEALRDKVYGIWTQLVQGGVTQAEVSAALAYFAKTYLEEGDKANRWADVLANRVVDGCDRLDSDNFERTAAQVDAAAVNAYIKTMDTNKNVVRLIFR